MAVAHGFQRPTVHIQRNGQTIPFDVQDIRVLRYDMTDLDDLERARDQLAAYAKQAVTSAESIRNPLSIIGQFTDMAGSQDPLFALQTRLVEMIEGLRGDVRAIVAAPAVGGRESEVEGAAKELGLARISVGGLAGPALADRIRRSRVVRVMSTSGVRFVESYSSAFVDALASGCELRLLLPQPDGQFVRDVEAAELLHQERPMRITDEIQSVQIALGRVLSDAEEVSIRERNARPLGAVQIRFFSTELRSTIIVCDDSWGWLTLTLPPARAADSPSLEMTSIGTKPLLGLCLAHFDSVWELVGRQDGDTV